MQKRNKRFLFSSLLILGILLFTLLLGYVVTQSSWFLNVVRKTLISQVNKQINGSIDIANIEGNIFENLTLEEISLSDDNSAMLYLKELDLNYNLRQLLQKKIIITSISLSTLNINLHQDEQGIWNLANIPKIKEKEATEKDTTSSPWQIELESFVLSDSKINISGSELPDQFPHSITISELLAQASLGQGLEWTLSKAQLAVQPQEITLSLRNLQGNEKLDISLEHLDISSPKSQIQLAGDLINQPVRKGNVSFQVTPISFSEIQTWIPSFPLQGKPNIAGNVEVYGDSLSSDITVKLDEQLLELQAQLPNFQNPLTSHLDLSWENININSWKKDLPDSSLNGTLLATTKGDSLPEVDAQLTLKLNNSNYNSAKIHSLFIEAKGSADHVISTIQVKSEFGEIDTNAELENLLDDIAYELSGSLKDLDLLKIVPTLPYQALVNSQFNIEGKGVNPKELDTKFSLDLAGSYFADKPLNKFNIAGNYQKGDYSLKEMIVNYDGIDISVDGKGNIYGNHELSYNIKLDNLPQIVQEFQPELALQGIISGRASGTAKDLITNTSIELNDVKYQDFQLTSLIGESEVKLIDQKPEATFTASLTKIDIPSLPIDSILITSNYTPEKVNLDLNIIQSDTLGLDLTGDIFLKDKLAIFSKLDINALGQNWQNSPDTLRIDFNPNQLSLQNLALKSDSQVISANLAIDTQESYDVKVKFDSLALWPLRYLDPQLETINGKMSLDIEGKASLAKPQVSVIWNMDNLKWKQVEIKNITGDFDYHNDKAQIDLEVNRSREDVLSLRGYIPLHADISKKKFTLLKDEQLNLDLLVTPLDLSLLNDFIGAGKEVKGTLDMSGKIENTLNNPQMEANLLLSDVAFKHPAWGIDYRDINLDFQVQQNLLRLKELSLNSGEKGYLKINGSTLVNLTETQLDSINFSLNAKDWQVLKNRDMDLEIDSKLELGGNSKFPTFSGYLDIQRASLYLPALLASNQNKVELTTPLLLANSQTEDETETDSSEEKKKPSRILKNLRGNMTLSFPNNTWINSKEMNLELGGELEIIKNSPDFALSGNVTVVRGNYTVYGRKFSIKTGDIYFQGESDFNPEISLSADYILRNSAQEKVTLTIEATGRLQQPSIQFLLDDQYISEGDGVSYIIFGKSTAELSSGEKSQISGSGQDNLATKILINQVTSRLSNALQNTLNLDVVEFNGDDNWRQAQVVVGKYLTNDLFLSYEKEFSFGSDNEITPDKFTLEYELLRWLFLQGTQGGDKATGVDLIWKYQK